MKIKPLSEKEYLELQLQERMDNLQKYAPRVAIWKRDIEYIQKRLKQIHSETKEQLEEIDTMLTMYAL